MATNTQTYQELFMPTPAGFASLWSSARKSIHEEGIIDFVSKLSPWIAPLPSAWFVHDATVRHLAAGSALAWIIAVVIETLGLTQRTPRWVCTLGTRRTLASQRSRRHLAYRSFWPSSM